MCCRRNRCRSSSNRETRSASCATPGRILAETLQLLVERVRPGLVERELDEIARKEFKKRRVMPTFLGYSQPPYPATICVSVNDEIVHGIPGIARSWKATSLASTSAARTRASSPTWPCRSAPALWTRSAAADRRDAGGAPARDRRGPRWLAHRRDRRRRPGLCRGRRVSPSCASTSAMASAGKCTRTRRSRTTASPSTGAVLRPGMVIAIEPMVNMGDWRTKKDADNWTVRTLDGASPPTSSTRWRSRTARRKC